MDCTKLVGRMRSICEGTSGLPEETRQAYLAIWEGRQQPPGTACIYRHDQIDTMECGTCAQNGKRVQVKVYQCDLFQRCVLMRGTSTRYCGTCESRLEKEP